MLCHNHLSYGAVLILAVSGCGPSNEQLENRKSLEMLLTAITLRSSKELLKDAKRIDERHEAGVLSEQNYGRLAGIVARAKAGDWGKAEEMAYTFREEQPFFK